MYKKILLSAAAVALATSGFAQYSFDDITSGNWGYYFVPENPAGTPPTTAVAENTVLSGLGTISDVELMVYNPTAAAISGATVTLSIMDSSATNPNPGGPGSVLFTQTYSLSSLAATTYYDFALPLSFTPTNTNIWTAFSFSNASVATLINLTGPSVGSASATTFAALQNPGGWNDSYELTNSSSQVIPPYFGIRYDLAPAPEPVSMAFLSLGAVGLMARRRRRS